MKNPLENHYFKGFFLIVIDNSNACGFVSIRNLHRWHMRLASLLHEIICVMPRDYNGGEFNLQMQSNSNQ